MTGHSLRSGREEAAPRLMIKLHVQPGAGKNEIVGRYGDALKVKVAAPAVDNKANAALIELLSATLGIPRSAIVIRHGAGSRRKLVGIMGGPELARKLKALDVIPKTG